MAGLDPAIHSANGWPARCYRPNERPALLAGHDEV